MSLSVDLLVSLKIPDVTALTARRALQGAMGYADALADLRRADWWRLSLNTDSEAAALALGQELAERTNLFVNPNKHVFECVRELQPPAAKDGLRPICVVTGFHDDPRAALALRALTGRLGYGGQVEAVEYGVLWTLFLRESDATKAQALAEAMTVSTTRTAGLLVNPHSQWWRWVGAAA
jgi:phosphoribosylformylglycinamidine (FGAM) synthase PurS component